MSTRHCLGQEGIISNIILYIYIYFKIVEYVIYMARGVGLQFKNSV